MLVYEGNLNGFLDDNAGDEDVFEEVKRLEHQDTVEFNFYHSGDWRIEKIK